MKLFYWVQWAFVQHIHRIYADDYLVMLLTYCIVRISILVVYACLYNEHIER